MGTSKRTCTMPLCEKPVEAHDLCKSHVRRLRLYGDPTVVKQAQFHGLSLRERLMKRLDTRGECWLWTGSLDNRGYGHITIANKPHLVHRVMWEVEYGAIPAGKQICHRCDVANCLNPAHLFLGDYQSNTDDKMAKGRHRYGHMQGEKHGMAKLTEAQVRAIRASMDSNRAVARVYGVSKTTIKDIRHRKIWTHVAED